MFPPIRRFIPLVLLVLMTLLVACGAPAPEAPTPVVTAIPTLLVDSTPGAMGEIGAALPPNVVLEYAHRPTSPQELAPRFQGIFIPAFAPDAQLTLLAPIGGRQTPLAFLRFDAPGNDLLAWQALRRDMEATGVVSDVEALGERAMALQIATQAGQAVEMAWLRCGDLALLQMEGQESAEDLRRAAAQLAQQLDIYITPYLCP
jgi:hypothetical protein